MQTPEKQIRRGASIDPDATWQTIKASQEFRDVPTVASSQSKDCTRIVCMSDTHGQHRDISLPKGDILIHAGDFTQTGEARIVEDLALYFQENLKSKKFSSVICIAGNHDLTFDLPYYQRCWRRFHKRQLNAEEIKQVILDLDSNDSNDFHYLEDSSCEISINQQSSSSSLPIYGSPWSPEFFDWAFNVPRGPPSLDIWSNIPTTTDVLVTHGPPLGRGDLCTHGGRAGCYDLLQQVQERVKPRLMIFGHIHEGYGTTYDGTTLYVNASNLDLNYEPVHPCTVIDLPHDPSQPARVVQPHCEVEASGLIPWFREKGYDTVANVMERYEDLDVQNLPSGDNLLDTAKAYKSIRSACEPLQFRHQKKAARELRQALLQLHAESF